MSAPVVERAGRHRWRRAWAGHDFRRLWAVRLLGQAGDGAFQVSLAAYVLFDPTQQATAGRVAAAFAVLLLPYSLVGPFAGVLLDRWRRRQVLLGANAVRAVVVVGVALVVASGLPEIALVVPALAVLSVNRFVLSGLSAALPRVVPRDTLVLSGSVTTTSGAGATLVGGLVGLVVQQVVERAGTGGEAVAPSSAVAAGGATAALVGAGLYALAALAAARIAPDRLGPDDPPSDDVSTALRTAWARVAEGARHLGRHPAGSAALAVITAHRFFYGLSFVLTLLLYRNFFRDPADTGGALSGLAVVVVATAAGGLVGAVLTPRAAVRLGTVRWVVVLLAVAAVTEVVLGLPFTEPAVVGAAFVLAVVAQGMKVCVDATLQDVVEDAYRGRVFAFYDIVFNVAFVAAAATGALVLPDDGKSHAVIGVVAAGYAACCLAYAAASRRIDEVRAAERAGVA